MTTKNAAPGLDPLTLLSALVLEDGRRWGEAATEFQRADAEAALDLDGPRLHFLTRPRGGSKTTDAAGVALAALITQAPPRATLHAFARDKDQAALLVDAIGSLVHRTGLAGLVDVGAWAVTVPSTGARLIVESADAASALGAIPYMVIVDELANWPTTRGARNLWEALVSGLPKRADSRLVVITTAGDPAHWSHAVLSSAVESARWRVSQVPGPLPWSDPDDLAEQRRLLPESAYARLHLNAWTAAEDRLVDADDLAACITLDGPLDPQPGRRYVIGLDIGLKNDRTVLTVCHAESDAASRRAPGVLPRVVLDRLHVLSGTRTSPVQLGDVEALAYEAATTYGAPIRLDPWQAAGLAQRLRARGIRVEEWTFSAVSVGRIAMTLHLLLRERRLDLPDDPDLLDELSNVRLRETRPGVYRLDHDSGHHDDRAVSLGLAALALTERPDVGTASVSVPRGKVRRTLNTRAAATGSLGRQSSGIVARGLAHDRAKGMPRGVRGILGVPGAHDDPRRRG